VNWPSGWIQRDLRDFWWMFGEPAGGEKGRHRHGWDTHG
jgi:hypothetical protein